MKPQKKVYPTEIFTTSSVDLELSNDRHFLYNLNPNDHIFSIFGIEPKKAEFKSIIVPFIKYGLLKGENVIYFIESANKKLLWDCLAENDFTVQQYVENGQLCLLKGFGSSKTKKKIITDKFLENISKKLTEVNEKNQKVVRLAFNVDWVFQTDSTITKKMKSLNRLFFLFSDKNIITLCHVNWKRFKPVYFLEKVAAYSTISIGTKFFGSIGDITQVEETRIELEKRRRKFIEITSHELRTPLTSIKGFVDILQTYGESLLPIQREKAFRLINKNLSRLEVLINNVSDISLIESGMFSINARPINFCEFLNDEMLSYKSLLGNQFEYFPCLEDNLVVEIDEDRIHQVFNNLISNAIKHTSNENRKILCSVGIFNDVVRITISDNGVGIGTKNLQRIFSPFSLIETKYSVVGTGIGMFLSREIVKQHKGTLKAQNKEKNKGAVFTIELPRTL